MNASKEQKGLLDHVDSPDDLKTLTLSQLERLAREIRQKIIETVHGGKVFVTSNIGEGSTFGFDMPLAITQVEETVK